MAALAPLPPLPPQFKSIQHHLRTAQEHDKRDPVVAYYCESFRVAAAPLTLRGSHTALWLLGQASPCLGLDLSSDLGTGRGLALLRDPHLLAAPSQVPESQNSNSTMMSTASTVLGLNVPKLTTWAYDF